MGISTANLMVDIGGHPPTSDDKDAPAEVGGLNSKLPRIIALLTAVLLAGAFVVVGLTLAISEPHDRNPGSAGLTHTYSAPTSLAAHDPASAPAAPPAKSFYEPVPHDALYQGFAEAVTPPLQQAFRSSFVEVSDTQSSATFPPTFPPRPSILMNATALASCEADWQAAMDQAIKKGPDGQVYTNSTVIWGILRYMGIHDLPAVQDALKSVLFDPRGVHPTTILDEMKACAMQNAPLMEFACDPRHAALFQGYAFENKIKTAGSMLHLAVVLQTLTVRCQEDHAFAAAVTEHLHRHQWHKMEAYVRSTYEGLSAEFRIQKMAGVLDLVRIMNDWRSKGSPSMPTEQQKEWMRVTQINIGEAAVVDLMAASKSKLPGFMGNFWTALGLMANIDNGPTFEDYSMKWKLGKTWVDAYNSWNMAYVMGEIKVEMMAKLYIPSVLCTTQSTESWLEARLYSLLLAGFFGSNDFGPIPAGTPAVPADNGDVLAAAWGASNLQHSSLVPPTTSMIEETFYRMCGDACGDTTTAADAATPKSANVLDYSAAPTTRGFDWGLTHSSPSWAFRYGEFNMYITLIVWITVLLAGFGAEATAGRWMSSRMEAALSSAPALWPLLTSAALFTAVGGGMGGGLALPLLAAGLWKCGLPETLTLLHHGTASRAAGWPQSAAGLSALLGGVAKALNAAAVALVVCCLATGLVPCSRALLAGALPLVVQHWLVPLKQLAPLGYLPLALIVEVVWQWEVLASFEDYYQWNCLLRFGAAGALLAHYIFAAGHVVGYAGALPVAAASPEHNF